MLPVMAAAVFAPGNTVAHAIRTDIHNFWDGATYIARGAIAGAAMGAGVAVGLGVPEVIRFSPSGRTRTTCISFSLANDFLP